MAAKWQQWMPLNINKIRGSMFFKALPDGAKVGYLFLLMAQWETDDGALPNDADELAILSGLGDKWAEFGPRIMRKFDAIEGGKVRNVVNYQEWLEAKRVFEARSTGGKRKESLKTLPTEPQDSSKTPQAVIQDSSTQEQKQGHKQEQGQVKQGKAPSPGANGEFLAATALLQDCEIPATSSDIRIVAQVIQFESKQRTVEQAVGYLTGEIREARARGEPVTVFWLKDRKYLAKQKDVYQAFLESKG